MNFSDSPYNSYCASKSDASESCGENCKTEKPNAVGVVSVGGELRERSCDSLLMCILTTLNQGLRNGGGIGDILRAPASTVRSYNSLYIPKSLTSDPSSH